MLALTTKVSGSIIRKHILCLRWKHLRTFSKKFLERKFEENVPGTYLLLSENAGFNQPKDAVQLELFDLCVQLPQTMFFLM